MKYIRTKDGRIIDLDRKVYGKKVIHLEKNQLEEGNWAGWYWYTEEHGYEIECRDLDILKQADTIEELCDEFVIINDFDNGINTLWHTKVFSLQEVRKMVKYNEIYGAIWTDKGLIYVAKMNEKGVLELL